MAAANIPAIPTEDPMTALKIAAYVLLAAAAAAYFVRRVPRHRAHGLLAATAALFAVVDVADDRALSAAIDGAALAFFVAAWDRGRTAHRARQADAVLNHLALNPGATGLELCRATGMGSGVLYPLLDRLLEAGRVQQLDRWDQRTGWALATATDPNGA